MKKIFSILAIAAAMVACSKDDATTNTATDVAPATYTLTGYSSLDTRTEFGEPNEETKKIPFHWSEGDKILVPSTTGDFFSEGVISTGASTATATFSVDLAPEYINRVYYNLNVKKGSLGTITADAAATANVPAEQSTANNLGENGDFGYAEVKDGAFTLNHATAYLWFDVKLPTDYTLQSICFDAGEAKVAGKAMWNGSAFGEVTNDSSVIDLVVDNDATMVAMVVLPATIESATITYKLFNGTETKYQTKTLSGNTIASGKTYKISADLAEPELYELRVLTFEDSDWSYNIGGETYYVLDYFNAWTGKPIYKWSDLIDTPQYSGPLLYGNNTEDAVYYWYDNNNTELYHMFPEVGGRYCFWGGGHAISNYWGAGYANEDRDRLIAEYYGDNYVTENAGNDASLGWFCLQLMNPIGAHSGQNFAVHFGYADFFNDGAMSLPQWTFGDEQPRIIDHMWVTSTNYFLNQLLNGVGSEAGNHFGGNWTGLTDDAWLKIVAYGYENIDDDEPTKSTDFYLVKGQTVVEDWQKWDLSSLGKVAKVVFNFEYHEDMGGMFGFTIPAYFAYDDVAVRFYNDEK